MGKASARPRRSGNGTATVTFRYKVRNGDFAPQGIRMGTTLLPDGIALHATDGTALTTQQLTLPWGQNPLTGVILDAPKLNNGVGIGVGGTPPGHGGTPPGHANPPGHGGTPPQTNPPSPGSGNSGNVPGPVPSNVGPGNAGSGNSTNGNGNAGNGNSNNSNKGGDDKGKDHKEKDDKEKDDKGKDDKKDDQSNGNKGKEPKRGGAFQPGTLGRLSNLSTRLRVSDADSNHSAVAGFVVSGTESKSILVRAVGPGLESFGIRDAPDRCRQLSHRRTVADQVRNGCARIDGGAQPSCLVLDVEVIERAPEGDLEDVGPDRLRQVVVRACAHRTDRGIEGSGAGQQQRQHVRMPALDRCAQLDARQPRHLEIRDDDVDVVVAQPLETLRTRRDHVDLEAAATKALEQEHSRVLLVVDEKDRWRRGHGEH